MPSPQTRSAAIAARILLGALALALAPACDHEDGEVAAPTAGRDVPVFEGGVVRFSRRFAERIGYRTEEAAEHPIVPVLHVTGVLEFDERRLAAVGSRISGRITEVLIVDGAEVEAGQLLATLESAELGEAQAEIHAVRARAQAASANESRKMQLAREGIASQRSAEVAAQEADVAEAELMAARHRVQALIGDEDVIKEKGKVKSKGKNTRLGLLPLRAPIGGRIVGVHVFRGQAVEPSHTAFTIADPSQLWVRLAVFEGELKNLREGDVVEIESQTDAHDRLSGTVAYVSPALDATTMAAEVRVVVPNPDGKLRAGQAVNAHILTSGDRRSALAVPLSAVVQVDGQPTVFVETGEGQVTPRAIVIGVRGMQRVEILSGVAAGERVVVDGVFAIKSELFR